jgi:hypothetical protein
MAAPNTFGVAADGVRYHHFPQFDAFSASSNPTLATVTEMVSEVASELAGRLNMKRVASTTITDTTSPAYLSCRRILRMAVAARIAPAISGVDSALVAKWEAAVSDWYELLAVGGAVFLGDGAADTSESDPSGPNSHATVYGLTTDSAVNMSTTIPKLRKDDQL